MVLGLRDVQVSAFRQAEKASPGIMSTLLASSNAATFGKIMKSLEVAYDKAGKEGAQGATVGQNIIGIGIGYAAQPEIFFIVLFMDD